MAVEDPRSRLDQGDSAIRPEYGPGGEPSLGELFGQLTSDAGRLVRDEVALANP